MPDQIGLPAHRDLCYLTLSLRIEQAQPYLLRVLRENRKIHAFAVPRRAEGIGAPGPNDNRITQQADQLSILGFTVRHLFAHSVQCADSQSARTNADAPLRRAGYLVRNEISARRRIIGARRIIT